MVRERVRSKLIAILLAATTPILTTCTTVWRTELTSIDELNKVDTTAPFLKVHTTKSGLYVLKQWRVESGTRVIFGTGILYDHARTVVYEGPLQIRFEEITMVETNYPESVTLPHMVVLGVVSGVSLLMTAVCLASLPKGCFGSCPTFYAHDGEKMTLQAEGFSAAIAKVLEETDVDALYFAKPPSRDFELEMANEALETHAVEHVRLLAAPRARGSRVLKSGDEYWSVSKFRAPIACRAEHGDCTREVSALDELEYRSPADDRDLATRETIELTFPRLPKSAGLVIGARNTLLTTFLFYQALAWMGDEQGRWFAALENNGAENVPRIFRDRPLGDIDVYAEKDGAWINTGGFREDGPIARETQLILLPEGAAGIRLRMTRGFWKLGYVALVELGERVTPEVLDPIKVTRAGIEDHDALLRLLDPQSHLITYPSEAYTIHFQLPEGDEYELFVESRGYYYEWMRESWFAEKNPRALLGLLADPGAAFKTLAPKYKDVEDEMEDLFWQSRVGRK